MDDPVVFTVHDAGLAWRNPPGRVSDRPRGVAVWQFNLFHHPVRVRLPGGERRLDAPAGLWFAPHQPQWYVGADGGFSDDWLTCSGPLAALLARYGVPAGMPLAVADPAAVEACLHAIRRELDRRLPFADEALSDLVRALARQLGRGRLRSPAAGPGARAVLALREALRERCAEPWTVARMADEAGLGAHRFAVLYRRCTGSTPLADLTWFRLRLAQERLRGGATVAAAARACGFADPLYFSRVFRRRLGVPPSRCG